MRYLVEVEEGGVMVLEDIELLREPILDFILPVIEHFRADMVVGEGTYARTVSILLKGFTVVGTTTRPSRVDPRLRRCMVEYEFQPYERRDISQILILLAKQRGFTAAPEALQLMTSYCDGSPGNAAALINKLGSLLGTGSGAYLALNDTLNALRILGYRDVYPQQLDLVSKLRGMSGSDFEAFVAGVFSRLGYFVEITGATGDHGIDLMMNKDKQLTVVQCKRWDDPIGEPVLRDFFGSLVNIGARAGFVVTTSSFTPQAVAFAKNNRITLIDLDGLMQLVSKSNATKFPSDFETMETDSAPSNEDG
jgi:HJR/Mrr/RecB family endonuclease